ncbi:hypothetical protein KCV01_g4146, partial [Aureobasidium melanogenum]
MTIAPSQSHALQTAGSGEVEPLHDAVERLLRAADAEVVRSECEAFAHCLLPGAQVSWHDDAPEAAGGESLFELGNDPQSGRTLFLAASEQDAATWADMVGWLGRLAGARLRQLAETANLYEAISRLALAERLQRALYAIAEQAGAEHNMRDMMTALHGIVGSLMYAENFFIVLYDAQSRTVRFPYFVDSLDDDPPDPETIRPIEEIENSLTWHVLQSGRPLMGSSSDLERDLPGPSVSIGPPSDDWLGVPMKH